MNTILNRQKDDTKSPVLLASHLAPPDSKNLWSMLEFEPVASSASAPGTGAPSVITGYAVVRVRAIGLFVLAVLPHCYRILVRSVP